MNKPHSSRSLSFPHNIEYKVLDIPGKKILYDVRNAGVFAAHSLLLDILSLGRKLAKHELIALLHSRYSQKEVDDAFRELEYYRAFGFFLTGEERGIIEPCEDDFTLFSPLLILTTRCNLRCPYCFMQRGCSMDEDMTPETARAAIDFFLGMLLARGGRSGAIAFFGGEPLLNFSTLADTVRYAGLRAKEHNITLGFTVTTNGTLFSREIARFFSDHRFFVKISIDVPVAQGQPLRPEAGGADTYVSVKRNIRRYGKILKERLSTRATCTAMSEKPLQAYESIAALGVREIGTGICFYSPHGGFALTTREEIDRYLDDISEVKRRQIDEGYFSPLISDHFRRILLRRQRIYACGYGRTTVTIDPHGDIYPCYRFLGERKFRMGSIYGGIDRNAKYHYYKTVDQRARCRRCWIRYHCGGGCAGDHYDLAGDVDNPSHLYCYYQKEAFRRMLAVYDAIAPCARKDLTRKILKKGKLP